MRTGPFSDPAVVSIVNRYFVPFHMDNTKWNEARYGLEPGEENAYIMIETPDIPGVDKEVVKLDRLSIVLEPKEARQEMLAFLEKHSELYQPWPELARLEKDDSHQSRLRRAELLLDEGQTLEALALLERPDSPPAVTALLRARAYRMDEKFDEAVAELEKLAHNTPAKLADKVTMERIRLAFDQGKDGEAATRLDDFLSRRVEPALAAEAHWLRGWLHYRAGHEERAIDVWDQGITRYPPHKALYSQKAYFTMIRLNWELPDNVDQPY